MGFYLDNEYIDDSVIRSYLLNDASLSSLKTDYDIIVNESKYQNALSIYNEQTQESDKLLFLQKIQLEIPRITSSSLIEKFMSYIDEDNIDILSAVVNLPKTQLVALLYFIEERSDKETIKLIKDVLQSTTSKSRNEVLFSYINRESTQNKYKPNIFGYLQSSIREKQNNKKIPFNSENVLGNTINEMGFILNYGNFVASKTLKRIFPELSADIDKDNKIDDVDKDIIKIYSGEKSLTQYCQEKINFYKKFNTLKASANINKYINYWKQYIPDITHLEQDAILLYDSFVSTEKKISNKEFILKKKGDKYSNYLLSLTPLIYHAIVLQAGNTTKSMNEFTNEGLERIIKNQEIDNSFSDLKNDFDEIKEELEFSNWKIVELIEPFFSSGIEGFINCIYNINTLKGRKKRRKCSYLNMLKILGFNNFFNGQYLTNVNKELTEYLNQTIQLLNSRFEKEVNNNFLTTFSSLNPAEICKKLEEFLNELTIADYKKASIFENEYIYMSKIIIGNYINYLKSNDANNEPNLFYFNSNNYLNFLKLISIIDIIQNLISNSGKFLNNIQENTQLIYFKKYIEIYDVNYDLDNIKRYSDDISLGTLNRQIQILENIASLCEVREREGAQRNDSAYENSVRNLANQQISILRSILPNYQDGGVIEENNLLAQIP